MDGASGNAAATPSLLGRMGLDSEATSPSSGYEEGEEVAQQLAEYVKMVDALATANPQAYEVFVQAQADAAAAAAAALHEGHDW